MSIADHEIVCPSPKSLRHTRSWCIAGLFLLFCVTAAASPAAGQSYFFKSIDDPSASGPSPSIPPRTLAFGINDSGAIVGSYSCCDFGTHAFLFSANSFTTVDYPSNPCGFSHCGDEARGINDSGEIVGDYTDWYGNTHGYTYANGSFNVFDFPGSTYMQPNAINNLGEIVGIYDDASFVQHGFIYNGGFASVDCPNGGQLFLNGVNDAGDLVGYCFTPGQPYGGFKLTAAGQFVTITFPGAIGTRANGINSAGQIVGEYIDSNGKFHGFLFSGGKYATMDYPASILTEANAINNSGQIAGDWAENTVGQPFHGFLAYSAQLVDAVPDLLSGSAVRTPSSPADAQILAAQGQVVQGVAADGVTEALVRIPANNVGDQFTVTVLNDSSQAQSTLPDEDGALGKPGDTSFSQSSLNTAAVATNNDPNNPAPFAFAIYRAPLDFARPVSSTTYKSGGCGGSSGPDDQSACRTVTLQIQNLTAGSTITVPVSVLRPPVVLIHGLWASWRDWNSFGPLVTGPVTVDPRFSVGRVSYDYVVGRSILATDPFIASIDQLNEVQANSLGFAYNAPGVLSQIGQWIKNFKSGKNPANIATAGVQADIVGHSMGGVITRTIALQPTFLSADTFGHGSIHKVITVDTPHLGSPVAIRLLGPDENGGCLQGLLAANKLFAINLAVFADGTSFSGAIADLQGDGSGGSLSPALQALTSSRPSTLPTSLIAGIYTNFASLDDLISYATVIRHRPFGCPSDPLAQLLTSTGWPTIFNNQPDDDIVSETSQLNNLPPSPDSQFFGYGHSRGTKKLGFAPPFVTDAGPVPNQVIFLLNTPYTNTVYYNLLNP